MVGLFDRDSLSYDLQKLFLESENVSDRDIDIDISAKYFLFIARRTLIGL
jgi:hypothetical protein